MKVLKKNKYPIILEIIFSIFLNELIILSINNLNYNIKYLFLNLKKIMQEQSITFKLILWASFSALLISFYIYKRNLLL